MQTISLLLKTLRIRRWYINAIVLAGSILAAGMQGASLQGNELAIISVLLATCLLSSANYALNEVFDAESDSHHPEKSRRGIPSGAISRTAVLLLALGIYALCAVFILQAGSWRLTIAFFALLLSGLLYNLPPIRLKDIPYADFIAESVNYPIRLAIGWFVISSATFPASIFIGMWTFAMFLMAAKRFAEFRFLNDKETAGLYRKSFRSYSEQKLLLAMIGSSGAAMFMLGAITMRYQRNLLIALPFFIVFMVWLCAIAYQKQSFIKDPERLFTNKYFLVYLGLLLAVLIGLASYPHELIHF